MIGVIKNEGLNYSANSFYGKDICGLDVNLEIAIFYMKYLWIA